MLPPPPPIVADDKLLVGRLLPRSRSFSTRDEIRPVIASVFLLFFFLLLRFIYIYILFERGGNFWNFISSSSSVFYKMDFYSMKEDLY